MGLSFKYIQKLSRDRLSSFCPRNSDRSDEKSLQVLFLEKEILSKEVYVSRCSIWSFSRLIDLGQFDYAIKISKTRLTWSHDLYLYGKIGYTINNRRSTSNATVMF